MMALYAGTGSPGRVYKYLSGTDWELISGDLDAVVLCITIYDGVLYAGTTTKTGTGSPNYDAEGYVYRYLGGTTWEQVGDRLHTQASSLIVHDGELLVGTGSYRDGSDWENMRVYELIDNAWSLVYHHSYSRGTRAMASIGGNLYQGDYWWDMIYRNNSIVLDPEVTDVWGSCIWDFAENGGTIYAGAYDGIYWYSSNGTSWSLYQGAPFTGFAYPGDNIWALDSFKGDIYFGCKALYRGATYDHIWTAPGGDSSNILSLVSDDNIMYIGVGGELGYESFAGTGYVYSYNGNDAPALISPALGTGVQCLAYEPEIKFAIAGIAGGVIRSTFPFVRMIVVYMGNLTGADHLHFKLSSSEETIDTQNDRERFGFSMNGGASFIKFPADGVPITNPWGLVVAANIKVRPGAMATLTPSAKVMAGAGSDDWWNLDFGERSDWWNIGIGEEEEAETWEPIFEHEVEGVE